MRRKVNEVSPIDGVWAVYAWWKRFIGQICFYPVMEEWRIDGLREWWRQLCIRHNR